MTEAERHIAREAALSAAINGAISIGFFLAVFGGLSQVAVWGLGNYAFDFLPQSFAIGFMAALVPGLMCRKAFAAGRLAPVSAAVPAPGGIIILALTSGMAAVILGAGLWVPILWAAGVDTIGSTAAFALKVLYGAALGALVTAVILRRMLR